MKRREAYINEMRKWITVVRKNDENSLVSRSCQDKMGLLE